MSNPISWWIYMERRTYGGPHDYPVKILISPASDVASPHPFVTAPPEQYCTRLDTTGVFASLDHAVESLAEEVKAPFAVWAATRWVDELMIVGSFPGDSPPNRYICVVASAAHKLRWTVNPADIHEPYGGSTTDPPLLRGRKGETSGHVTQVLIEQALDEAEARGERVGIILDEGSTSRFHVVRGGDLADAPRETIIFVTDPPGDRSLFEHRI